MVDRRGVCAPSAVQQSAGSTCRPDGWRGWPCKNATRCPCGNVTTFLRPTGAIIRKGSTAGALRRHLAANAFDIYEGIQREKVLPDALQPVATTQHHLPVGWSGITRDLPGQVCELWGPRALCDRECSTSFQNSRLAVSLKKHADGPGKQVSGFVNCQVSEYQPDSPGHQVCRVMR